MENIKEIIYYALNEITACDQTFRLEPDSILNPLKRSKAINTAFKATCEKFKIEYTQEDLKPEGREQLQKIWDLIKIPNF